MIEVLKEKLKVDLLAVTEVRDALEALYPGISGQPAAGQKGGEKKQAKIHDEL